MRKKNNNNITSNRSSHIYFLQSDYSTVICVTNSHCLQNVRRPMGGSEFAWRTAHSAVKFVFYKPQPLRGKCRMHISAPFCAYASFINETPGVTQKWQCLPNTDQNRTAACAEQKTTQFIQEGVMEWLLIEPRWTASRKGRRQWMSGKPGANQHYLWNTQNRSHTGTQHREHQQAQGTLKQTDTGGCNTPPPKKTKPWDLFPPATSNQRPLRPKASPTPAIGRQPPRS